LMLVETSWSTEEILALVASRPADEPPARVLRAVVKEISDSFEPPAEDKELWGELIRAYPDLVSRLGTEEEVFLHLVLAIGERYDIDPSVNVYPGVLVVSAFSIMRWAVRYATMTGRTVGGLIDEAFDLLERGL
jgi:hypothetical protein